MAKFNLYVCNYFEKIEEIGKQTNIVCSLILIIPKKATDNDRFVPLWVESPKMTYQRWPYMPFIGQ